MVSLHCFVHLDQSDNEHVAIGIALIAQVSLTDIPYFERDALRFMVYRTRSRDVLASHGYFVIFISFSQRSRFSGCLGGILLNRGQVREHFLKFDFLEQLGLRSGREDILADVVEHVLVIQSQSRHLHISDCLLHDEFF